MIHRAFTTRSLRWTPSSEMPITGVRHKKSMPRLSARSAINWWSTVRRTPRPDAPLGNAASTASPSVRKRSPLKGYESSAGTVTPKFSSAARPSGIIPSPQGLSIGPCAPSATATRNPFCLAAIAAASPAGPPPITKTSVEFSNPTSPSQKYKLRTEPRSHRRQNA